MFKTIQEGVRVYQEELREYVVWTDGLKVVYGRGFNPMALPGNDYKQITEWNARLKAMEKVLGLSKEEIDRIGDQVGVEHAAA